jgi:hypothetical protein
VLSTDSGRLRAGLDNRIAPTQIDHVLPGWNDFKSAVSQAGGLNNISCGCGRTTGRFIIPVPGTGQTICAVKSSYLDGIMGVTNIWHVLNLRATPFFQDAWTRTRAANTRCPSS